MAKATIKIPCSSKKRKGGEPVIHELTGTTAIFPLGNRKVRFLITDDDELTHYASGYRVGSFRDILLQVFGDPWPVSPA
jgi:hypothetical protein